MAWWSNPEKSDCPAVALNTLHTCSPKVQFVTDRTFNTFFGESSSKSRLFVTCGSKKYFNSLHVTYRLMENQTMVVYLGKWFQGDGSKFCDRWDEIELNFEVSYSV